MLYEPRQVVKSLSLLLLLSACGATALRAAELSGVARDRHGTPQMGVLVELLGAGTSTTTLTDLQGRYQIRNITPGIYQLRATAALFLPSIRRQVRVTSSGRPVVNLVMSGLFDEAISLSTSLSNSDNREDWKWTLRSPANRPMLRLVSDDGKASAPEKHIRRRDLQGSFANEASRGSFGSPGEQGALTLLSRSADGAQTVGLRSSVARTNAEATPGPMTFSTMLESSVGAFGKHRTDVSVRTFPQVRDSRGDALTEFVAASAEQVMVGDFALLEVGSQTQLLRTGKSTWITHPFFHFTSRPLSRWTVSYGFSTQPGFSRYEDADTIAENAPTVVRDGGKLETDSSWHQEVAAGRRLGRAKVRFACSHDVARRTAITGRLTRSRSSSGAPPPPAEEGEAPFSLVSDVSNRTFRLLTQGLDSDGGSATIDVPLSKDISISGGYFTGRAVELEPDLLATSSGRFRTAQVQSATFTIAARVRKSGTRISASYRWQPTKAITTIAPYETSGTSPYLSIHIRQSLNATKVSPPLEFSMDANNMFQEGYQTYTVGRQDASLASALQELRAGISFAF